MLVVLALTQSQLILTSHDTVFFSHSIFNSLLKTFISGLKMIFKKEKQKQLSAFPEVPNIINAGVYILEL